MDRRQLNAVYRELDARAQQLSELLHASFGYYNGHYHKGPSGDYEMDHYPIPVITMRGVCDIEVDLDGISVTAKLARADALRFDFGKLAAYDFEVYGVENYLDDFRAEGDTMDVMLENIRESKENAIFFSFCFPCEAAAAEIGKLVWLIQKEGFFY